MKKRRELAMSISLNALEHLGMNLYSNVPAVLAEIVANAWDADAKHVTVTVNKADASIVIEDDGVGMTRDEVIDQFLAVGFKRREKLGPVTPGGRKPMGRKGIGKLSIFSIARTAEVYTAKGAERTAFQMDREVIRKAIAGKTQAPYKPPELPIAKATLKQGTRIVLSDLSKALAGMTVEGLTRRVARRFSVIGSRFDFVVTVNGTAIGPEHRAFHNALEYLWLYGPQPGFVKLCKHLARPVEHRLEAVRADLSKARIHLTGWIGTVANPSQLKDAEGDNLNRLAVFMRGKLAHEDILDEFGQKEIYADYVIGEIHCEELDRDEQRDIATTSRQTLKEDDPRFEALRKIVLSELRHIAGKWSDWRRSDGAKKAAGVPAVSAWLESLQGDTKEKAERWIGRLNTIRSADEADKRELLKASILAFESYRRKEELDRLEKLKDEGLEQILEIFRNIDDLELSYYGQIVKLRVEVIRTLQKKLKRDDKELVLRDYIFDHLWLLDPGWERAKGSEHAETLVNAFLKANSRGLKGAEKKARIDIGYRTTGGKHVIVELKRASIAVPLDDLTKQIRKYRDGAKRILEKTHFRGWPIEIICLVGEPPPEWNDASGTGQKGVIDTLKTVDARIVFYDELLTNAEQAYGDYLDAHMKLDRLWGIFEAIDDFAPQIVSVASQPRLRGRHRQNRGPDDETLKARASAGLPAGPFGH